MSHFKLHGTNQIKLASLVYTRNVFVAVAVVVVVVKNKPNSSVLTFLVSSVGLQNMFNQSTVGKRMVIDRIIFSFLIFSPSAWFFMNVTERYVSIWARSDSLIKN